MAGDDAEVLMGLLERRTGREAVPPLLTDEPFPEHVFMEINPVPKDVLRPADEWKHQESYWNLVRSRHAHAHEFHSFITPRQGSGSATSTPTPFLRSNQGVKDVTSCDDLSLSRAKKDAPDWKTEWRRRKQLKEGHVSATRHHSAVPRRTGSEPNRSPVGALPLLRYRAKGGAANVAHGVLPLHEGQVPQRAHFLARAHFLTRRPALALVLVRVSSLVTPRNRQHRPQLHQPHLHQLQPVGGPRSGQLHPPQLHHLSPQPLPWSPPGVSLSRASHQANPLGARLSRLLLSRDRYSRPRPHTTLAAFSIQAAALSRAGAASGRVHRHAHCRGV
ncbi:hypothetical protein T484DRAFT_1969480, partial [Baffinella frigidus]